MVVLIDTNVIIDFLVAREPFYDSALHVMEKCASGEAEGYMAFHSLPNLWYILRKVPAETRRSWLEKVCKILKVASASQKAVMRAIKMDNFKDFEDCLQDRCAEEVSALDMAIPYWADLIKGSGITLRSLGFSTKNKLFSKTDRAYPATPLAITARGVVLSAALQPIPLTLPDSFLIRASCLSAQQPAQNSGLLPQHASASLPERSPSSVLCGSWIPDPS